VAVFATRTRSYRAELVDISSTGLRLRADNLPAKDEDLMITVESARRGSGGASASRIGLVNLGFSRGVNAPFSAPSGAIRFSGDELLRRNHCGVRREGLGSLSII